jgi:hypothetical protein
MAKAEFPLYKETNSSLENQNNVYPGYPMSWVHKGKTTIQGKNWDGDSTLQCSGDPTMSQSWASIKLNTGSNHDCNVVWQTSNPTEQQVRGVYFRHHTNGAKFRPRISGVAMQYRSSSNAIKYVGLHYRETNYSKQSGGTIPYEGTGTSNAWWGVADCTMPDGDPYHNGWRWSGVLFHFETTFKTGSAVDCIAYINRLRPICDGAKNATPSYNNKYRQWGVMVK